MTSDDSRFLALLRPLEPELETYARRLLWAPQQAPDALQNAVLRAFITFRRYREQGSFRAWMFRILTREVSALNRKHAAIARHEVQLDPQALTEVRPSESRPQPTTSWNLNSNRPGVSSGDWVWPSTPIGE